MRPIESGGMPIRLRAFVLLLAIAWQTLSMLSPMSIAANSMEYEHAALHLHALDHHHHDDGSLHVEPSDNTPHHLHADGSVSATGLPPGAIGEVQAARLAGPGAATSVRRPSPCLDGPLRPPRFTV